MWPRGAVVVTARNTTRVQLLMTEEDAAALRRLAREMGVSMAGWVRVAVRREAREAEGRAAAGLGVIPESEGPPPPEPGGCEGWERTAVSVLGLSAGEWCHWPCACGSHTVGHSRG